MHGAAVGALVAVVAWLGLAAYLAVLNARLNRALRTLDEREETAAPVVTLERPGD